MCYNAVMKLKYLVIVFMVFLFGCTNTYEDLRAIGKEYPESIVIKPNGFKREYIIITRDNKVVRLNGLTLNNNTEVYENCK